jgi:hypothetical protein
LVDVDSDDFVVQEASQTREVLSVRAADYPIAIVVDNGRGSGRDFDAIRRATARFIGRIGHRPMVVVAANPPRLIATFDDDRESVLERLDELPMGSAAEGVFQAMVTAAEAVREAGAPFSAIVAVVAHPAGSLPTEFLTPILESAAHVHAVALRRATAFADEPSRHLWEALEAAATETRGQVTVIYSSDSYQAALDRLVDRLGPELMIEYVVPAGSPSDGDVQIGVRIPGARVIGHGVSRH